MRRVLPSPPTPTPTPLVGRDRELAEIDRSLAALGHEGPQLLDILGEPGIGKTTLLAELRSRAAPLGASVVSGAAQEFEQDIPFALVVDALGPAVDAIDPRDLQRIGAAERDELAAVFPHVAASAVLAAPRPNERYRLHRAIRELIGRLAISRPLVLVLDDLHWADPASAELIASLVRSPPDGPVLIAIGRRSTPLMPNLQVALDLAVLAASGRRVEPSPLSFDAAQPLFPASLPAKRRAALYEQSGGNPFYLDGLSRSSSRTGASWGGERDHDAVPASIAAVVHEELLRLSPEATLLLRAAAVVGDPFDITLATTTAALEQAVAFAAIDELAAADLARPHGLRTFSIRHPLLRKAVYEATPVGWRLGAHARAAAALARVGAPASVQAHHVEHCAAPGDSDATELLAAAARDVASRAPATAARWLASAVRIADDGTEGGAASRAGLVPQLTAALVAAGRLDEAYASALETLDGLSPGEPGYVESVGLCAAIERMLGRLDAAHDRLGEALERLPPGDVASAVSLRLELAADASLAADFELMRTTASRTLADAREMADAPAIACATAALSFAEYSTGRFAAATLLCEQAAELVSALTDAELASRLETILHLGWAEWFMGRFDLARALFDRGTTVARETGGAKLVIELSVGSIVALTGNGRLAQAMDLADGTSEEARLMGNGHTQVWALFAHCMALEPVVDPAITVGVGHQAVAVARRFEGSTIGAACGWVSAAALVAAGDGPLAVEVMLELQGGPELPYFFPAHRATCYEILVRAELLGGRQAEAEAWAARARKASDGSLPYATAMADRAEAQVALAAGDATRAVGLARASVEAAAALGAVVEAERGRLLLGRALISAGERDAAAEVLREAEATLLGIGAHRLHAEAIRDLRRIGRRPTRQGRAGRPDPRRSGALSPREREVAGLAASGKTNREIAAALFLSEKTIETHMASTFAKLGVKNRRALPAALTAE